MSKRMDWEKLLSAKRVSEFNTCQSNPKKSQFPEVRSPFERDYDQIIFSYPFRRLQDKTQVIPFPKYDFVHTRLTHSMEVASIGRSLGTMAGQMIVERLHENTNNFDKSDFETLVAAACLAHDIGNPPFGHSGEEAISHYFTYSNGNAHLNPYSIRSDFSNMENMENEKKWCDLIRFEGNANGFRILTEQCDKGINPTAALLGTFTKYPRESHIEKLSFRNEMSAPKSQSKHGFFQEQKKIFKFMAEELGLLPVGGIGNNDIAFHRHPLVFLME